jgi:hypothetical protein
MTRFSVLIMVALAACGRDVVEPAPPVARGAPVAIAARVRPVLPEPSVAAADSDDEDSGVDDDVVIDRDSDDGIPDVEDRCPDQPETSEGFEDVDGCPDPAPDGQSTVGASLGTPLVSASAGG